MVGFGNFAYCPKVIYPLYCCQSVVGSSRLLPIEICSTHIFIYSFYWCQLIGTALDCSQTQPSPTLRSLNIFDGALTNFGNFQQIQELASAAKSE
jgi:hypothetical protein